MYQQRELYTSVKIYVLGKSGFWSESHNFMNLMLTTLVQDESGEPIRTRCENAMTCEEKLKVTASYKHLLLLNSDTKSTACWVP
uniref:Uncharacterized protein n=1 Tax=Helianthus annuus TaxID=4232 RepID=A0A251SX00_HELAN